MDNKMEQNENLFFITRSELNLIMALEDIDEIGGIGVRLDDMSEEDVTSCYRSLQDKNYITKKDDDVEWNARFIAWIDVICKAKRYVAVEIENENIAFYFMGETIVSIEKKNDEITILWIPYIHLAIGQFLNFIDTSESKGFVKVIVIDRKIDDSMTATIGMDELLESLDLQNDITQKMVRLHVEELKEVTGYEVNVNE